MARILIIDDEELIRTELRHMLEGLGYVVDEAENGRAALKVLRNGPPDLVITDIVMADMDGIETIRAFKAEMPEIRIIAMSGGGASQTGDYLVWAEKLGADAIVPKPINIRVMREEISALLKGSRSEGGISRSRYLD